MPTSNGKEQYGGEVSLSSSTDPDGMAGSGKIGNRSLSDGRTTDDGEGGWANKHAAKFGWLP